MTDEAPYYVYCYCDSLGTPLYIGMTYDVAKRRADHARKKSWFPLVAGCGVAGPYTWEEAFVAEAEAIREVRPLYNRYHNFGRAPTARQRLSMRRLAEVARVKPEATKRLATKRGAA